MTQQSIAVGPDGTVFVSVNIYNNLHGVKYDPDGQVVGQFIPSDAFDIRPTTEHRHDIAVGPHGNVFVAANTVGGPRVAKFDPGGDLLSVVEDLGPVIAEYEGHSVSGLEANGIAVGPDGSAYVAITADGKPYVLRLKPDGSLSVFEDVLTAV